QGREQQQRDDVGDLDHRVDGGAGGVLVGIADRVAGHRGLVGFGALAAVIAVFDIFFGVVPGAAAAGHRDGDEQAGDDYTEEQSADRGEAVLAARYRADHEIDDDWGENRKQRRNDHLADRGLGHEVDGTRVIG